MDPKVLLCMVWLCFFLQFSRGKESVSRLAKSSTSTPFDPSMVTRISWSPRAFVYKGFLTDEECAHLISLAEGKLEKSMVSDGTGKFVESEYRTSSGMFIAQTQDEIVAGIEAKIATWTFLPRENGERLQILHYGMGQKYGPHVDSSADPNNEAIIGNRVATVLMYLSDVQKGGETIFPRSEAKDGQSKGDDRSECASNGYAVKAKKGDALLFFSLHPNRTLDPSSLHGGCPVIEGEKWSATKWIHTRSFKLPTKHVADGVCVDKNPYCSEWALEGECEKNPLYLVGSDYSVGYCRKSCGLCSSPHHRG